MSMLMFEDNMIQSSKQAIFMKMIINKFERALNTK